MNWPAESNFFAHLPIDWIILGVLAAVLTYGVVRAGPNRISALVLALPTTILLSEALPNAIVIGNISTQLSSPVLQAIIFGVLFICSYILARHLIPYGGSGSGLVQGTISGIAATVIVVVVWTQVPGLQSIWHFSDQVQNVFGEAYRFWWLIGSYVALVFARS